jgi:hypothetical protein
VVNQFFRTAVLTVLLGLGGAGVYAALGAFNSPAPVASIGPSATDRAILAVRMTVDRTDISLREACGPLATSDARKACFSSLAPTTTPAAGYDVAGHVVRRFIASFFTLKI